MFEYKKVLKEVERLESMIDVIENSKDNSGYRVQISYCNGKLYSEGSDEYLVDIYVIDDYQSYSKQGKQIELVNISNHELEEKLPCKVYGDPIQSKGVIKSIKFNKEAILEELKENEKYIVNTKLGIIEKPIGENKIISKSIIPNNIEVYFSDYTSKECIENMLMVKTEITEEFGMNPSYFDVSVQRGKLNPYIKKGKTNLYLRSDVEKFLKQLDH